MVDGADDSGARREEYRDADGNYRALTLEEIERTVKQVRALSAVPPGHMEKHITRSLVQRIMAMMYQAHPEVDAEWCEAHEKEQMDVAELENQVEQLRTFLLVLAAEKRVMMEKNGKEAFKSALQVLTRLVEANANVIRANLDWDIARARTEEVSELAWEWFVKFTQALNDIRKEKGLKEHDPEWFLDHPHNLMADE